MSGDKNKERSTNTKKEINITSCISCESYYYNSRFLSERKNGITLKPGKIYCLFPKKPIKLDARKRHIGIPANCPRHDVPIQFTVYTPKKKVHSADSGNANRYWRAYTGNITMITLTHLFGGGSYTTIDSTDGFLWDNGAHVHKVEKGDVIVREDGFTILFWRWNGKDWAPLTGFDGTGIKKIPKKYR